MERIDNDLTEHDSSTQLDKNISRLVMLADDKSQPGRMFKDRLINNALGELGKVSAGGEWEQNNSIVTISPLEKVAAMVAVVCGAGFGVLFSVLAYVNSSLTGILLIAMFFNRLIYYGGLIL
jgi:hypothetical protein